MKKALFILQFLLFTSLCAQEGGDFFQTEAEMGMERSRLSGSIQIGDENNASSLDINKDLGITKSALGLHAMLSHTSKNHKFGFKVEKYEHTGSTKLSNNIIYNGSQYANATLIKSKISLRWAKAKYRYRYTKNLSLGLDINGMRFKTMLNDNEVKKTVILPAIGIDYDRELEAGLHFITKASSTITGSSSYHYGYAGFSYDLKVHHCTCLHIGYQYKKLLIHKERINVDLKYQGLYAGLAMKF